MIFADFFHSIGQFEFLRHAVAAGVLVSLACGVIGVLVTVNRIVFISGGIAHTAYGGIGIGFYLGVNPAPCALVFSVVSALAMGWIEEKARQRADTVIGILWAVGMGVGILFIDATPGYKADLMTYLFGSILAVSVFDLVLMAILNLCIVLFVLATYRQQLAASWDGDYARTRGIPVRFYRYALLVMTALSVVLMMRVVGLILVIALLTIPAASAALVSRRMGTQMWLSILYGLAATQGGLMLSFYRNKTSGATIILAAAALYVLTYAAAALGRGMREKGSSSRLSSAELAGSPAIRAESRKV